MKVERPLVTAPQEITWRDVDIPDRVEAGKVRLRTLMSLISPGTELRLYGGDPMVKEVWDSFAAIDEATTSGMGVHPSYVVTTENRPAEARFPVTLGYNTVGEVVEVGEGVARLAIGDRVIALARHQVLFDVLEWQGVKVPDEVPTEAAPFAYLPTLGLHALRRAQFAPGESVAIIGLGLVGLGAALVADAVGARVLCLELNEQRRDRAAAALPQALVLDPTRPDFASEVTDAFHPNGIDIVIEAGVGRAPLDLGIRVLDAGGRMVAIALHPEDVGPLLAADFYNKQVAILGTSNAPYEDPALRRTRFTVGGNIVYLFELYARGRLPLEALHTDTYPSAELAQAYRDLATREKDMVGVLLDWS